MGFSKLAMASVALMANCAPSTTLEITENAQEADVSKCGEGISFVKYKSGHAFHSGMIVAEGYSATDEDIACASDRDMERDCSQIRAEARRKIAELPSLFKCDVARYVPEDWYKGSLHYVGPFDEAYPVLMDQEALLASANSLDDAKSLGIGDCSGTIREYKEKIMKAARENIACAPIEGAQSDDLHSWYPYMVSDDSNNQPREKLSLGTDAEQVANQTRAIELLTAKGILAENAVHAKSRSQMVNIPPLQSIPAGTYVPFKYSETEGENEILLHLWSGFDGLVPPESSSCFLLNADAGQQPISTDCGDTKIDLSMNLIKYETGLPYTEPNARLSHPMGFHIR